MFDITKINLNNSDVNQIVEYYRAELNQVKNQHAKELQEKDKIIQEIRNQHAKELQEKDKIIRLLEKEILKLKSEI